ncbi:MAG: hypothetical protein U0796_01150 [Gemmatales bacterium]
MKHLRSWLCGLAVMSALTLSAWADDDASLPKAPASKKVADSAAATKEVDEKNNPTHDKLVEIKVKGKHSGNSLQTLCSDAEGNILAVVAPARYGPPTDSKSAVTSEVQVFSSEGKAIRQWNVPFKAQCIASGPDGKVYVAGDAHIATFEKDGKLIKTLELPHIAKLSSNKEQMKKDAEVQLKQEKESFAQQIKQIKDMKDKLEKKKADELTARDKQMIKQYEQILESYKESEKYYSSRTVDSVVSETLTRLRYINAVAVSDKELFIVCGETKGWGYAVWRMNHQFEEPKQVIGGLGGCCGQMDICCEGENILVAENTLKKFARYSREGKSLGKWGKPGDKDMSCFGGCCNPMNLRAGAKGDIFTAESEGFVKRFSATGEFLGVVGKVQISGGCKNVAIAMSPNEEKVYFCDQPGSKIFILARKKLVVQK